MRFLIFLIAIFPLSISAQEATEGKVHSVVLTVEQPRSHKARQAGEKGEAPFSIWIPEGSQTLKGLVMNPFYEPTVGQKHWQAAVRHWGFGLVGANLAQIQGNDLGKFTEEGLRALAKKSGHPELGEIGLCLVGMSAGGGMSTRIAEQIPARVIAAAPVCLEVGPRDAKSREIPMVTIFGEKDGSQMKQLLEKLPVARAKGAKWGLAVQWGRRHEFGQANNLIMPFFDAVIRGDLNPQTGSAKTWGLGEGLSWLPNPEVAAVWEAFVFKERKVRLIQPTGLGDKQPFRVCSVDERIPIEVRTEIGGTVKIYNANQLLGEAGSLADLRLPVGIHSIIAAVDDEQGKRWLSRPHTVIVR